jgi:ring-1,2-phenylacetyl-CoA epoxidase subunit PaaD
MVTCSLAELTQIVTDIDDPELPHVTIGDLGIVRDVRVDGTLAIVVLTPTYTGCPATEQIRDDVAEAVRAAGFEPRVEVALSPAWTTDWISERGRQRLAAAGIAPPPGTTSSGASVAVELPVACPRCGSRRTRLVSVFGSTACKAAHVCEACREPFDAFKAL